MTNLNRATKIRRTVTNKAYDLLKDCKEPEPIFGYDKEHWTIDANELHYEVVIALRQEWNFEEGDEIDKQIAWHVNNFLDDKDYQTLKERVRTEYYQYQSERRDLQQTNRAHQPTWRPS